MADEEGERRGDGRGPIELKVEYKRLNAFFADYTKNISKDGTFIRTNKPLGIGTEFVFKLFVPQLEQPLRLRGKVRWTITEEEIEAGSAGDHDEPGMGIRFLYVDDAERRRLQGLVEKLMVDSLGQFVYRKLMERSRLTASDHDDPDTDSKGNGV